MEEETRPAEDIKPEDRFADVKSPQFIYTYLRRKHKKQEEESGVE